MPVADLRRQQGLPEEQVREESWERNHECLELFILPRALACFTQENPTTLKIISDTPSALCVPRSWTALCGPLGLGDTMLPSNSPKLQLRSYVQEQRSELVGEKEGWGNKISTSKQTTV